MTAPEETIEGIVRELWNYANYSTFNSRLKDDQIKEVLDRINKLAEYDKQVADNCRLIANATAPGTWEDPATGKKLYNQAAVREIVDEIIGPDEALTAPSKVIRKSLRFEQRQRLAKLFKGDTK